MMHSVDAPGDDTGASSPPRTGTSRLAPGFDALYQTAYADMVRLAFFLTGSRGQAEEATQTAFLRLYERWPSIDDHAAYLRTSVVNEARSWHRARFAALRRATKLARPDSHIDQPDELIDALARLPRRRREVVVLRYYAGFSLVEIASALGITEGTVKSTLHHGLNDLKKALT